VQSATGLNLIPDRPVVKWAGNRRLRTVRLTPPNRS